MTKICLPINPTVRIDDGGEYWHIVAGALIGGGFEFGSQLLSGQSIKDIKWGKVAYATVSGGTTAAFGPAGGALLSAGFDAGLSFLEGERNWKKIATAGVMGGASSLAGSGANKLAGTILTKIKLNQLSKLSKTQLKLAMAVKLGVKGAERNAIKSMSYLVEKYSKKLVNEATKQVYDSTISGFASWLIDIVRTGKGW